MDAAEIVGRLSGETDAELVQMVLADAQEHVLAYTNRVRMIPQLEKPVRDLAVIALNRMGTEGESSRSGSGESYTFDNAPKQIYDVLDRYRLARVGGRTYEAETKQAADIQPQDGGNRNGQ